MLPQNLPHPDKMLPTIKGMFSAACRETRGLEKHKADKLSECLVDLKVECYRSENMYSNVLRVGVQINTPMEERVKFMHCEHHYDMDANIDIFELLTTAFLGLVEHFIGDDDMYSTIALLWADELYSAEVSKFKHRPVMGDFRITIE